MKKIFAVTLLLTALLVNCASAEKIPIGKVYDRESRGAAYAPEEINHPNSIYYSHVDVDDLTSNANRIILSDYPTYQQMTGYSCGPSAALTVLYYFGVKNFDEATLVKRMNTKPLIGTSLSGMVNFFRDLGWEVHSRLDTPPIKDGFAFKDFVRKNLSAGTPVMVENIEFGGHWRVIIGYDTLGTEDDLYDDVLIFVDPYDTSDNDDNGFTFGSADRFFSMWFDHNMLPENEREQPWLTARPK